MGGHRKSASGTRHACAWARPTRTTTGRREADQGALARIAAHEQHEGQCESRQ